jgi:hypothetical protein
MRKKLRNENQKVKSTVHHIIFTYPLKTNCFLALFLGSFSLHVTGVPLYLFPRLRYLSKFYTVICTTQNYE